MLDLKLIGGISFLRCNINIENKRINPTQKCLKKKSNKSDLN